MALLPQLPGAFGVQRVRPGVIREGIERVVDGCDRAVFDVATADDLVVGDDCGPYRGRRDLCNLFQHRRQPGIDMLRLDLDGRAVVAGCPCPNLGQ